MPEAGGPQAQGPRVYISGKSREHMLQVICIGTLKLVDSVVHAYNCFRLYLQHRIAQNSPHFADKIKINF